MGGGTHTWRVRRGGHRGALSVRARGSPCRQLPSARRSPVLDARRGDRDRARRVRRLPWPPTARRTRRQGVRRRLLEQVVRNYLRDQARATTKGRLVRRLRELLEADPRFAGVPRDRPGARNIELSDGTTPGVWNGRLSDLVAAAYKVTEVSVVRWRPEARRQSPVADAASLTAVCEAVLRAAGASLPVSDLADVVAARFAVGRGPVVTPVDDIEPWSPSTSTIDEADAEAEIRAGAERLISQLTLRERLVLAYLDRPVRQIADLTGLGKSVAAEVASRVRQIVGQVLGADEQREAMFAFARSLVTPTSSS